MIPLFILLQVLHPLLLNFCVSAAALNVQVPSGCILAPQAERVQTGLRTSLSTCHRVLLLGFPTLEEVTTKGNETAKLEHLIFYPFFSSPTHQFCKFYFLTLSSLVLFSLSSLPPP